ncbi:glycosyltransferase family 39 protein [bacterium]|nr:glycosyltransferase family 39 protein [FCB group bacterium]MBL7190868.1 glycosyltransferase family 39 protein [bacterium]
MRFRSSAVFSPAIPLIIGAVLRFVHLGGRSLWVDEGLTAMLVSAPIKGTIAGCAVNSNPPLFYIVLWPWVRLLGVNEFSLALFSTIAGLVTIYLTYKLALYISDHRTAFLASLIAAFSSFLIYASNDARPYSFLGMAATAAAYFFFRAINEDRPLYWILTWVFTAASVYTHLVGWSVVLFEVLYLILAPSVRKGKEARFIIMTAAVLIIYIPQFFTTLRQMDIMRVDQIGVESGGLATTMFIALKQFLGGFYRIMSDYYFMDLQPREFIRQLTSVYSPLFIISLIAGWGIPLFAALFLLKHRPQWGLFLILMYLTPFVQVFWEGTDPRRFTPPAPALYIIIAMAWFSWNRGKRLLLALAFFIITAFSLGKTYSMTSSIFKPEDYRQVSHIIRAERGFDDAVVFYGGSCGCMTWKFYDPGGTIFAAPEFDPHDFSMFAMPPVREILSPQVFPMTVDSLLENHSRVWMVISKKTPDTIKLAEAWNRKYNIKIEYTDKYLVLLNISDLDNRAIKSDKIE